MAMDCVPEQPLQSKTLKLDADDEGGDIQPPGRALSLAPKMVSLAPSHAHPTVSSSDASCVLRRRGP